MAMYDKCSRESNDRIRAHDLERSKAAANWESLKAAAAEKGLTL